MNPTITIDKLIQLLQEAKSQVGGDIPVFISEYPGEDIAINEDTTGMDPSDTRFYIGI